MKNAQKQVAQNKIVEIIDLNFFLLFSIRFRNPEFACWKTFILLPFIALK